MNYAEKSFIHINGQLTSPYFFNYSYKLKDDYLTGTLRYFDPIKNYYVFQPKFAPERPTIVPLEALEPCEEYHTYHLEGSMSKQAFLDRVDFHIERKTTDLENEIRKAVKASITNTSIDNLTEMLADLLSGDDHFMHEYKKYKNRAHYPEQTDKL